jgi:hypothetical protein
MKFKDFFKEQNKTPYPWLRIFLQSQGQARGAGLRQRRGDCTKVWGAESKHIFTPGTHGQLK